MTPTLLAWCSRIHNKIKVADLETKQNYTEFEGVQIKKSNFILVFQYWSKFFKFIDWQTYVHEVQNTKLLVSLNYFYNVSANLEIFDISRKTIKKIYSFEEIRGGNQHKTPI